MAGLFGGGGGSAARAAAPAPIPVAPGTLVQTPTGRVAATPRDTLVGNTIIGAEDEQERQRRIRQFQQTWDPLGGGGEAGASVGGPASSTGAESTSADGTI